MRRLPLIAISLLLSAFAAQGNDGDKSSCYIPKGTRGAGLSFSYNDYSIGDNAGYNALFSMIEDIKAASLSWSFSAMGTYFIKDDISVGLRLNYDRTSIDLESANLSLADLGLSLGNHYHLDHQYTLALATRYYTPLGRSGKLAYFTELRAKGGFAQGKTYMLNEGRKEGTFQTKYSAGIYAVPGVSLKVSDNVAVEACLEILGLDWQKTVQLTNQVDRSVMTEFGINYKVNLLSTELGIVLYF